MREIGSLRAEQDARRFNAYLTTEGISSEVAQEADGWTIWVRDEDDLDQARRALEQFRQDPASERYRDVERQAEKIRPPSRPPAKPRPRQPREPESWQPPDARRCPVVLGLIVLSVGISMANGTGETIGRVEQWLNFCEVLPVEPGRYRYPVDGFREIKRGQIWRTVTPIFLHYGIAHLIFNMAGLYYFGGQIEGRRAGGRASSEFRGLRSFYFALLVLTLAVVSNVAQYAIEGTPRFGGMSGVVYGLFGYVWIRTVYGPGSGMYVHPSTVTLMLVFFALCFLRDVEAFAPTLGTFIPKVANTVHAAGLIMGMALAFVVSFVSRQRIKTS